MDWSAWTFGDDNATNAPSSTISANTGVTATSTPSGGTITVGLTTATPKPSTGFRHGDAQAYDLFRRFLYPEAGFLRL